MPRIALNMPKMSMTMEFGTVVEWNVEQGDVVNTGDVVAIVTTDKVDMDVEATCDGELTDIVAQPGQEVAVGQPIAYIESETEDLLGDLFEEAAPQQPRQSATGEQQGPEDVQSPAAEEHSAPQGLTRIRAVPLARQLAAEAGLDLASVEPGGPGGTIRARDVRAALDQAQASTQRNASSTPVASVSDEQDAVAVAAVGTAPLAGSARERRHRIATAKAMAPSAHVPQFTIYREMELTALARARKASLEGVSWTSILLRAYALVLAEYPTLNGYWTDQGVRSNDEVAVSLAVDTPSGLLAPVLGQPHVLSLRELDRRIKKIAQQAKDAAVDPELFTTGTGTVSNLGSMSVTRFNALLTPPQATALSLGVVRRLPRFDQDGQVQPMLGCEVGLTIDHRAADGADGARALETMQQFLNDPLTLLASGVHTTKEDV